MLDKHNCYFFPFIGIIHLKVIFQVEYKGRWKIIYELQKKKARGNIQLL